jgi:hypothetical protein
MLAHLRLHPARRSERRAHGKSVAEVTFHVIAITAYGHSHATLGLAITAFGDAVTHQIP